MQHAAAAASSLQKEINAVVHYADETLHQLQAQVRPVTHDLDAIRRILSGQSYHNKTLLRFAWIDANDMMRVSSSSGIRSDPYSLSQRAYLKCAREAPFTTLLSPVLQHPITQKPVLVMSMGVATDAAYLGTLNAVIHLEALDMFIRNHMQGCDCQYRVYSPFNEQLYPRQPARSAHYEESPPAYLSTAQGFKVISSASAHTLHAISTSFLRYGSAIVVAMNLLLWLMYRSLYHRIIRPIHPSASHRQASFSSAEHYLAELSTLSEHYADLAARLKRSQRQLSKARIALRQLTQEQKNLSAAASHELLQCFAAISRYADQLDDRIAAQLLQPDQRYDYDDVCELGSNLPRLARGLAWLQHRPKTDSAADKTIPINITTMLHGVLASMHDHIDRRNLMIEPLDDRPIIVSAHHEALALMLECIVFEWIRCSEDEATLTLRIPPNEVAPAQLHCISSRARQEVMPPAQRDISVFLPSRKPVREAAWMIQLANLLIAKELGQKTGLSLTIEPEGDEGFCLKLIVTSLFKPE